MTAADRTSKLLDKLQQVEAIGEGARQAMRKENVDLAAHEEELLEEVQGGGGGGGGGGVQRSL